MKLVQMKQCYYEDYELIDFEPGELCWAVNAMAYFEGHAFLPIPGGLSYSIHLPNIPLFQISAVIVEIEKQGFKGEMAFTQEGLIIYIFKHKDL